MCKNFFTIAECPDPERLKFLLSSYKIVVVKNPKMDYLDLAIGAGSLVNMDEDLQTGNKTDKFWTDIRFDPSHPDSFRHSNTAQPLHTDGAYEANPPDISFFYCIEQADFGGATTFIDYDKLVRLLELYDNELLQQLLVTPIIFKKGDDGKTSFVIQNEKLAWNYFRAVKTEKTANLIECFNGFLKKIQDSGVLFPVTLSPGEAVFFWDEELLHGRYAFWGSRWLKKGGIKWTETN